MYFHNHLLCAGVLLWPIYIYKLGFSPPPSIPAFISLTNFFQPFPRGWMGSAVVKACQELFFSYRWCSHCSQAFLTCIEFQVEIKKVKNDVAFDAQLNFIHVNEKYSLLLFNSQLTSMQACMHEVFMKNFWYLWKGCHVVGVSEKNS